MKKFLIYLFFFAASLMMVTSQNLFLIGGALNDSNTAVWGAFVNASFISGKSNIGIITAASEPGNGSDESVQNGQYYINLLKSNYNVSNAVWLPIDADHISEAYSQENVDLVNNELTAIFFGGGDQMKLIQCFLNSSDNYSESPVLSAIKKKFQDKQLIVGGTSAGCAILQKIDMVTGGESWNALVNGSYDYIDNDIDDLSYFNQNSFGFIDGYYVDMHVGVRGRQGRGIRLIYDTMSETQVNVGIGVDQDTCLAININNGFGKVLGSNGVYIYDLSQLKSKSLSAEDSHEPADLHNVRVSYLTQDDQYNLNSKQIIFASWKSNIKGQEEYDEPMSTSYDIFSSPNNDDNKGQGNPEEFTIVSTDLFNSRLANSTSAYTYEEDPTFRVDMTKDTQSVGYVGSSNGNTFISYQSLCIDIYEDDNSEVSAQKRQYMKFFRNFGAFKTSRN